MYTVLDSNRCDHFNFAPKLFKKNRLIKINTKFWLKNTFQNKYNSTNYERITLFLPCELINMVRYPMYNAKINTFMMPNRGKHYSYIKYILWKYFQCHTILEKYNSIINENEIWMMNIFHYKEYKCKISLKRYVYNIILIYLV